MRGSDVRCYQHLSENRPSFTSYFYIYCVDCEVPRTITALQMVSQVSRTSKTIFTLLLRCYTRPVLYHFQCHNTTLSHDTAKLLNWWFSQREKLTFSSGMIMQNDCFNKLHHIHWQHVVCKAMRKFLRLHAFAEKTVTVFMVYRGSAVNLSEWDVFLFCFCKQVTARESPKWTLNKLLNVTNIYIKKN